jgi:hypothetical protein
VNAKGRFYKAVEAIVHPALRQDGFTGFGPTLRAPVGDTVHIFSFQDRREGGSACVNMGVHPLFLPSPAGKKIESWESAEEYECEFRQRLAPEDHWWAYEGASEELATRAKEILNLYRNLGRSFYSKGTDLISLLSSISPADVSNDDLRHYPSRSTTVRAALTLARLCLHFGRPDSAVVFARVGLEKCGRAVGLKPEFQKIINGEPDTSPNGGTAGFR